jgi:hypothetical protein
VNNICLTDQETVESVHLIVAGTGQMRKPRFGGDIVFDFHTTDGLVTIEFIFIASVMYFHEVFARKETYPYIDYLKEYGLFECLGSSYLERFISDEGALFTNHRHFGHIDDSEYFWNIIAKDIKVTRSSA